MIRTQVLKHLPGARGRGKKKQKRCQETSATAGGAMEKSWYVRVIERKEVREDDLIKYFLPTGSEVPFESQRGDGN